MDRGEAIALLKEIAAKREVTPSWVSLVNGKAGYEVHLKPDVVDVASLRLIVEKHNLVLKKVEGLLVVCEEHDCPQGP